MNSSRRGAAERKFKAKENESLGISRIHLNLHRKGISLFSEAPGLLSKSYRDIDFGFSKGDSRSLKDGKGGCGMGDGDQGLTMS